MNKKDNNLLIKYPQIAKQWHPTKNKDLKPEEFPPGTNKKVWWKCDKGDDHEWEAAINGRALRNIGCPFCAGKRPSKDHNFLIKFPQIAKQWHPTKNKDLKPEEFTPISGKKVWWKCDKGDDHEWEGKISNRTRPNGGGCPFCWKLRFKEKT